MKRGVLLLSLILGLGCGDDDTMVGDAGPAMTDSGAPTTDSGTPTRDSGTPDAGQDAGPQGCTEGCSIEEIAVGSNTVCVRRENGGVRCWGGNFFGQLGDGRMSHGGDDCADSGVEAVDCSAAPVAVSGLEADWLANAGGVSFCAGHSGGVSCWGLGTLAPASGEVRARRFSPEANEHFATVDALANSSALQCAVADGSVRCRGEGGSGQLGHGMYVESTAPVAVDGVANATSVVTNTASNVACAIHGSENAVQCWGRNGSHQLAAELGALDSCGSMDASYSCSAAAQDVPVTGVEQLVAGAAHVCALNGDGEVWCWGGNYAGQLGVGTTDAAVMPVQLTGLGAVSQLAAGNEHTCVLLESGDVRCWGRNEFGQLGDGDDPHEDCSAGGTTIDCATAPVDVDVPGTVKVIGAGGQFSCAVNTDDEVYCWGENFSRQLGQTDRRPRTTPIQVVGFD